MQPVRSGSSPTWNQVKPSNRDEARIWNYYNSAKWDWYKIRFWPRFLAVATIKKRLRNRERFSLFMYFVGNGMSPNLALDRIQYMGQAYFDGEALRQLRYLRHNYERYLYKYKYFDEHSRQWQFINK